MPLETYFKRLLMCRGFRIQAGDASFYYELQKLVICLPLKKRKKREKTIRPERESWTLIHVLLHLCPVVPLGPGAPYGNWLWGHKRSCSSHLGPICRMHFLLLLRLTFTPAARSVCNPCLWRWVLSSVLQEKQVRIPSIFDLCYWREQLVPPDGLSVLLWHFLRSSSSIYLSFSSNTKSSLGSLICLLLSCCVLTWWDHTWALHFSNLLEMTLFCLINSCDWLDLSSGTNLICCQSVRWYTSTFFTLNYCLLGFAPLCSPHVNNNLLKGSLRSACIGSIWPSGLHQLQLLEVCHRRMCPWVGGRLTALMLYLS